MGRKPSNFTRSVAVAFREQMDSRVMFEFLIGVLEGKSPLMERYKDADGERAYRVIYEDNCVAPTIEQRIGVWKELMDRGYGRPAQTLDIEAHVLSDASSSQGVPLLEVPASMLHAMSELLGARATPALPSASTHPDAIDAEFTEGASTSDDSSDAPDASDDQQDP